MKTDNNPLLILLGSILTFAGTWFVEYFKNRREKKENERNFKLQAKQEFSIINKTLDNLKTILNYKNYYEYSTLERLKISLDNLESYKKDAIYLSSPELQEKYIDLVSDISVYKTDVKSLQDLYYTEQRHILTPTQTTISDQQRTIPDLYIGIFHNMDDLNRYFNEKKLENSITHTELIRRIEEIIKELKH